MSDNNKNKDNEKEQEARNNYFVQLDKRVMKEWRLLVRKNPVSVEIMYFFMERMGYDNAIVCSYKVLEEITGTSRATVGRALKALKHGRWIEAIKIGSAHAYVVNEKVAWQTYSNQRQYAMFRATIVAAKSEQTDDKPNPQTEDNDTKTLLRIPVILNKTERPMIRDDNTIPPPDQSELELN